MKKLVSFLLALMLQVSIHAQIGANDPTFSAGAGPNSGILATAIQADDKILTAGTHSLFNGVANNRIIRLNSNGSSDGNFSVGTGCNGSVYKIKELGSGKILASGQFTMYNSAIINANRLVRLNPDGSKDAAFTSTLNTNGFVYSFAEQSDGKVVLGGAFTRYAAATCTRIARANLDGTNDATFVTGTGIDNNGYSIVIQNDGKILVGGIFNNYNGNLSPKVVRLNSNGSFDNGFNVGSGIASSTTVVPTVFATAVQADGKIIIGGSFDLYNGNTTHNIVRVNSDGSIDNSFSGTGTNGTVRAVTIQADGKIIVNGQFTTYNGITKNRIVRLNSDGSIDNTFNGSGADMTIFSVGIQSDGAIIAAGDFKVYSGDSVTRITRIIGTCINPTISISGGTVTSCIGSEVILTASGASSYLWDNSASTASISVSPSVTTTYTVTGTDALGCFNSAVKTITVSGVCPVSAVPCGYTITNMISTLSANNVTGAVNYRLKFYNSVTSALVATKIQSSRTFTFSTIPGIYYGNIYKWTVAVDKGNGYGPESNSNCLITFAAPKSTLPCNVSYSNLSGYSTCTSVAAATNYRFKFYNNATGALLATKTQTSNYIYLNQVSPALAYGNTYKWTVEVEYNNGTGLVYGEASQSLCTVTINAPKSTLPCNVSYSNLSGYSTCTSVSAATNYRFKFYIDATGTLLATKTQTSNYIYLNQVSPALAYGNTYKWTVEVEYNNGTGLVYGVASQSLCTVTINAPRTTVPCGVTYASGSGYSAVTPVSGALGYKFTFYDAGTMALVAAKTNTNNYVYFNQVPGLIYNKAYKWTVEVQYFNGTSNVFGPASTNTCSMTWGVAARMINNDNINYEITDLVENDQRLIGDSHNREFINVISVYPNPTKDFISIESDDKILSVQIINISGEILFTDHESNKIDLSKLTPGLYFVKVETENGFKCSKIIKD